MFRWYKSQIVVAHPAECLERQDAKPECQALVVHFSSGILMSIIIK